MPLAVIYNGANDIVIGHPTIASSTTYSPPANPNSTGTAALTATHPTMVASEHSVVPAYGGNATLSRSATLTSYGHYGATSSIGPFPGVPLFVSGFAPFNNGIHGMNLFLKQVTPISTFHTQATIFDFGFPKSPPLFVRGTGGIEYSTQKNGPRLSLFVVGFVPSFHEGMNLVVINARATNTATLFARGTNVVLATMAGSAPLYVYGAQPFSSFQPHLPLYIAQAQFAVDSFDNPLPLFVAGPTNFNTHVFDSSLLRYDDPTLFVQGGIPLSFNRVAYLFVNAGGSVCETMNLVLQGLPVVQGRVTKTQQLFVYGDEGSTFHKWTAGVSTMNLVIRGVDAGGNSRILRLVVTGQQPGNSSSTPLFVRVADDGQVFDVPLFVRGLGGTPGGIPGGESMNLFIARGPNAGVTLFARGGLQAATSQGGTPFGGDAVPLSVVGSPAWSRGSSTTLLFIRGFGGSPNGDVSLFVNGDVFHSSSAFTSLILPKVLGFTPTSAALYTNGFYY